MYVGMVIFLIVQLLLCSPGWAAYCSSNGEMMTDGAHCIFRQRVVCKGGIDVKVSVCRNGCEGGECLPDEFCYQKIELPAKYTPFCAKALEDRPRPLYFDAKLDAAFSDTKARAFFNGVVANSSANSSGNLSGICINQTYMYACGVYFVDCDDHGDVCRGWSGMCDGINLTKTACFSIPGRNYLPLILIAGIVTVGALSLVIAIVIFDQVKRKIRRELRSKRILDYIKSDDLLLDDRELAEVGNDRSEDAR